MARPYNYNTANKAYMASLLSEQAIERINNAIISSLSEGCYLSYELSYNNIGIENARNIIARYKIEGYDINNYSESSKSESIIFDISWKKPLKNNKKS